MPNSEPLDPFWVPLMEGVRMIARSRSETDGDTFTNAQIREAAGLLEMWGREGRLRAEGLRYLDQDRTALMPPDWMALHIYDDNRLDDPARNPRARRVRIINVVVDGNDVRNCTNRTVADDQASVPVRTGRPPKASWPEIKLLLRGEIERLGAFPERGGPRGWQSQADAARFVRGALDDLRENVEASALKANTKQMLDELRVELVGKY